MILCRYFDDNGVDVLQNLRLKVNNPLKFNDPFDSTPYYIEGEEVKYIDVKRYLKNPKTIDRLYETHRDQVNAKNKREFKRAIRSWDKRTIFERIAPNLLKLTQENLKKNTKQFSNICRVLCFSKLDELKSTEEILMWSHYSKGHSGVRISFDAEKFKLRSKGPFKVEYRNDRVKLDLGKLISMNEEVFEDFGNSLLVKSIAWAYEHEYRWLIHIEDCIQEAVDGRIYDFIKISPEAIVRIDIGVKSKSTFREKVINLLKTNSFAHADLRIATLDKKKFKLNY